MAEHDPDPHLPHDDDYEQVDNPPPPAAPAGPRQRRAEARAARARELEEQAAAAAEQARLEAEQDASDDDEDVEDDEDVADPDEDEDEDDNRVPSVPKGALKLPIFDGSDGMEKYAISFLKEFESYCEFYRVSGKQRIPLLYTCFPLQTPARSWFQDCKRRGLFTSYVKFQRMFKEHYGINPAHSFVLIRKLERLSQKQRPIGNYYAELVQSYSDLSLLGVNYSDHQKLTRFVSGMSPTLRKRVEDQMSSLMSLGIKSTFTLSAVYNMASAQERTIGSALYDERKQETAIEVNAIDSKALYCGFCHKLGHRFDDCEKVKARKANGTWDYNRRHKNNPLHKTDDGDN